MVALSSWGHLPRVLDLPPSTSARMFATDNTFVTSPRAHPFREGVVSSSSKMRRNRIP